MKHLENLLAAAMCAFILLLFASSAAAGTIYVKWNSPTPDHGQSWDTAYHTVQAGIGAAVSGDEIRVAAGTYVEAITLKDGIKLLGGFSGVGDERDRKAFETVVSGSGVTSPEGVTGSTKIAGFTLKGGGIFCTRSSPVISENTIVFCGVGINCWYNCQPLITNNTIAHNRVYGIEASNSSSPRIANNMLLANQGGGVYVFASCSPIITNNTIVGNGGIRGGICWADHSSPTITNNIVAFNFLGLNQTSSDCTAVRRRNCVYSNVIDYAGGLLPGDGDILLDPKLASQTYGNMHIMPGSPCIDAGDDSVVQPDWTDFEGQARTLGAHVDIGADESDGTSWADGPYCVVRVSPDGSDSNDGSSWSAAKRTVQAGIDAASLLGGEVWVKGGVYGECITLQPFSYLYGGFNGTETQRSQRNWAANISVLDGQQAGSVVTFRAGWNMSAISGFTIRNGSTGGISVAYCSPTISNNIITRNNGGLVCSSGSPIIVNNDIVLNATTGVGGIALSSTSGVLANNTITNNAGGTDGGGIKCSACSTVIANNIIALNTSGIYSTGSAPTLDHNCVFGNAGYDYITGLAHPTDLNADPKLADTAFGNTHIQPYSPCVDAGDDSVVASDARDIDCQPRILGQHVDIGADESNGFTWTVSQAIIRVSPDGNDANDGSTWPLAKKTIGAAITAASSSGGEIWVCRGTYTGSITLKACVYLYGGFDGTETQSSQRNWRLNKTVLNGGSAAQVVTAEGVAWTGTLDGFEVRGGMNGIYCHCACLTIANNLITNAGANSGIYCYYASPTIIANVIRNSASQGIYCTSSSPLIANNFIIGNQATVGGAIRVNGGLARIYNNTMVGNSATCGGAVCYESSTILRNNLIAFNSSGIESDVAGCPAPVLDHNCVYGNGRIDYAAGLSPGPGSVSEDPKLASAPYGNVHIQPDSPCIDAGDLGVVQADWTDADGQPRVQGASVDIGADESDTTEWSAGPYVVVRVSESGSDDNDGSTWAKAKHTVQSAIDAACEVGGDVWVKAGTYDSKCLLKPFAHVYGGFAGMEIRRSQRDYQSNISLIEAPITASGYRASTLDGFTLQVRYVPAVQCKSGCGPIISNNIITSADSAIRCETSAAPLITNNRLTAGRDMSLAGVYCVQAAPIVSHNTICNSGMGVYCYKASPEITCNVITGNGSSFGGTSAIYADTSSPIVINNLVIGNTSQGGSAIKITAPKDAAIVTNNTITGNLCRSASGALTVFDSGGMSIVENNIVAFNSSGVHVSGAIPAFRNNDVFGNTGSQYQDFPTDPTGTNGNISVDPLFRDLPGADYRLRWDSPCIDAGTNDGAPETDILGAPRPIDGNWDGIATADMGAYEYGPMPVRIDILCWNSLNTIELQAMKMVDVAIMGDSGFDVRNVDPLSVTFGPGSAIPVNRRGQILDTNWDRFMDWLFYFPSQDIGLKPGTSTVTLRGRLKDGERIEGSDWVKVKGFPNPGQMPR